MQSQKFVIAPPTPDEITDYDKKHFTTYLRLLDAKSDGADWSEAAEIIFQIDVLSEPEKACEIHANHLARAQWMAKSGYRHLLS